MGNAQDVVELRTAIIAFVRKSTYRTEATIVEYIMNNLRLEGRCVSNREAEYYLARCVEDGPLMWFGADEAKLGTYRAGQTPLSYRYAPLVSKKEKSMEIEGLADINAIVNLYKRCRKKNKPVEPALEALNKLGARRPNKQRFSLSLREGTLTLSAKSSEYLPESLQRLADNTIVGGEVPA